jgi:hypothetical protein
MAGLTVGAFVGIVGFVAVMLLVGRERTRRPSRRYARMAADQLVFIPPYPPPFKPSTALSARAFAKMGYDVDAPSRDPMRAVEIDMGMGTSEDDDYYFAPAPLAPLSAPARPHPLGVIKASSSAMVAAPIADLSFDDGPTEIAETYFDEPPRPRRRTDPPKIRPTAPAGPRFPGCGGTEP